MERMSQQLRRSFVFNSKREANSQQVQDDAGLKVTVNKYPVKASVNTNVEFNYIQPKLVKKLKLVVTVTTPGSFWADGDMRSYKGTCVVSVKLGDGTKCSNVDCFVFDTDFSEATSMTLGHAFFKRFKGLNLVYTGGAYSAIKANAGPSTVSITITLNGNTLPRVPLASGLKHSLINHGFAQSMNLVLKQAKEPISVDDSSGAKEATHHCDVLLNSGNSCFRAELLVVEDLSVPILLGRDYMSQHKEVRVTYPGTLPPMTVEYQN